MNEKLQYATMLEIPVSTCNVTFKPGKKKRFVKKKKVNHEALKKELLSKINAEEVQEQQTFNQADYSEDQVQSYNQEEELTQITAEEGQSVSVNANSKKRKKKPFKISVIGVQLTVIGLLIATIFLTNAIYPDSGVNVFLRGVFGAESTYTDQRVYADFAPVINLSGGETPTISEGVMTFSGEGAVYSPCDGKISAISKTEDGKFTIEITHSDNFKSLLTGIDYAYAGVNDTVYHNIPVGYVTAGATMCFKGVDGAVISDYQIVDDMVVWAV